MRCPLSGYPLSVDLNGNPTQVWSPKDEAPFWGNCSRFAFAAQVSSSSASSRWGSCSASAPSEPQAVGLGRPSFWVTPRMLCCVMSPALALRLGSLYFFFTRTYMCLDTCQKVWFYLHRGSSRKFAEGSRKGEAEDFFWNNEYGVNFMYICMLCYVMVCTLRYAMLCLVMLSYYVCRVMYVLYCNVM